MAWALIAKPVRGATTDGFIPDDTYTPQTDGAVTDPPESGASTDVDTAGAYTDPGGTPDGFYTREHTDGFFVSDGDWTPLVHGLDTWTLIAKPSGGSPEAGAYTDPSTPGAYTELTESGALTGVGDNWVPVLVLD